MYIYSDPSRESDPHALPNVEVWEAWFTYCPECGNLIQSHSSALMACSAGIVGDGKPCGKIERAGQKAWFYAYGFPGCLWDSEPIGPFDTEAEAIADMRENASE